MTLEGVRATGTRGREPDRAGQSRGPPNPPPPRLLLPPGPAPLHRPTPPSTPIERSSGVAGAVPGPGALRVGPQVRGGGGVGEDGGLPLPPRPAHRHLPLHLSPGIRWLSLPLLLCCLSKKALIGRWRVGARVGVRAGGEPVLQRPLPRQRHLPPPRGILQVPLPAPPHRFPSPSLPHLIPCPVIEETDDSAVTARCLVDSGPRRGL